MNGIAGTTRRKMAWRRVLFALALLGLLLGARVQPATAATAKPGPRAQNNGLVVEVMQTGRDNTDFDVRNELVFRVRAFDPTVGEEDGDGIRLTAGEPTGQEPARGLMVQDGRLVYDAAWTAPAEDAIARALADDRAERDRRLAGG